MAVPVSRHEALYRAYLAELEARWPGLRLVRKGESRVCRAIDRALRALTLGRQASFLDGFVTTLGRRIYVPDTWDASPAGWRYCVLRHEAVHVAQFDRLGWPLITALYLLLPLPMGLAAGRAWLEWQAYRESLVATWQVYGPEVARSPATTEPIVRRFTGPDYAWMWLPGGTVRRAIARLLAALEAAPPSPLAAGAEGAPAP